jgi:ADP-ribose pyrophosphatase
MGGKIVRYGGRYISFLEQDDWEYASRVHCSGVAVIVAVTSQHELLLVEQYRIPVQGSVIELPAGLIGDEPAHAGETGSQAALRELEEETGFAAAEIVPLLHCPTTAGLADEMATFYLATNLSRVHEGGGDDSEKIQVHIVSLDDIDHWLDSQAKSGKLLDPKIYSALYWLHTRGI